MLTRKWLLVLLAPALLCLCAADPEAYTSPDGKFAIHFASKPMESEQKTPAGPMKMYLDVKSGQVVMVMSSPMFGTLPPEGIDLLLDQSRDGIAGKGKVLSNKKIKLNDKYPGREMVVEQDGGQAFMNLRMFMVENDMYILMVTAPTQDAVKSKETMAFMDSFKLAKKEK
jgi:hypothetical protein